MLAYKFRSSSDLPFALDIIFNNRLYCADWSNLNDPMEGMFVYSYGSTEEKDPAEEVAEIIRHKKRIRICSLSQTFNSHLLWAHYASGFSGVALEVDLPAHSGDTRLRNSAGPVIKRVKYRGVFANVSSGSYAAAAQAAEQILSSKYQEWNYEKEIRILQSEEWYNLRNPVSRVIAGHRMDPALFEGLRIICEQKHITLNRTRIEEHGIVAELCGVSEQVEEHG